MPIRVGQTRGKGRGVFAAGPIAKGSVIESCPVIVIPGAERELVAASFIAIYLYSWDETSASLAIALGLGSLYNHSYQPNAVFETDLANAAIRFVALRDIRPDEEITVNYNGPPADQTPIWFEEGSWGW